MITRSKGDQFDDVQMIAEDFIQTFIDAYLKGNINGENKMKEHKFSDQDDTKNVIPLFKCAKCEKVFLPNKV